MRFGLMCAADFETVRNTKHWLAGFEAGEAKLNSTSALDGAPIGASYNLNKG